MPKNTGELLTYDLRTKATLFLAKIAANSRARSAYSNEMASRSEDVRKGYSTTHHRDMSDEPATYRTTEDYTKALLKRAHGTIDTQEAEKAAKRAALDNKDPDAGPIFHDYRDPADRFYSPRSAEAIRELSPTERNTGVAEVLTSQLTSDLPPGFKALAAHAGASVMGSYVQGS